MKRLIYTPLLTLALAGCSVLALANTNTAIASGAWETGSNWSTGVAPLATDAVIVPPGITMTASAANDVCGSLTIDALGKVQFSGTLSVSGNLTNYGILFSWAGATLVFNGASNSVISGGGTYTIQATVVLDMGSPATSLDVQDGNFIAGINAGGKFYFTFTQGTWIMDNTSTLGDSYNSGSTNALTIPYGVVIQANSGQMNFAKNGTTGNVILSGELLVNGGNVFVQLGQSKNSGQDFRYTVNGGTPQLYVTSGELMIGSGFNALNNSDYIDFHMTGGTIILAQNGYSSWITFQLADNIGGKTFMSAGLIILQDACNADIEDLDMGGANVAATLYSVTGGTVQLGYVNTQSSSTYFGIDAQPATNYPNIDFQAGVAKNVSAFKNGVINMLSLYINSNMTYDASGFSTTNIISNNGTFAFDDEGTFTTGNNTVEFSGSSNQLITSSALANVPFYNLEISNTSGNVTLGANSTVNDRLSFTSGLLDASQKTLTLANGAVAVAGASATKYVIVGNGVAPTTGYLTIDGLAGSSNVLYPIGTSAYYLPAQINAEGYSGTAFSAYVFTPATTNAKSNGTIIPAAELANMYDAVWNITQNTGTHGATIILNWATSGNGLEGSTFAAAGTNIGIAQYTSSFGWGIQTGSGNVATMSATSTFSTMSQFAIVDELFVLPVVVSNFQATLNSFNSRNTVQLSWTASDDAEITGFEVQRSTDGSDFTTIGTVQAASGENDYSLVDQDPAAGTNYYRVAIAQTDGSTMYSTIKTINLSLAGAITVYPVPATTAVNVALATAGSGTSVRLVSQTGQIMQTMTATGGSQVLTMDISTYPAGIYFVQVIGQNSVLSTTTVTKL